MIQVSYNSRLPAVIKEHARLQKEARRKALAAVSNRTLRVTLPHSVAKLTKGTPPSKGLNQTALRKQKSRIRQDILGDNKLGSGIRTATPTGAGGFVPDSFKGYSSMPFVVYSQKGRKKRTGQPLRGLITSGSELVRHIRVYSFLYWKKGVAHRRVKPGYKLIWTTLKAARAAAAQLAEGFGYLMSGWHALARLSQSAGFGKVVAKRTRAHGSSSASLKNDGDILDLTAYNNALPHNKKAQQYQLRVVEEFIPDAFQRALDNEEYYAAKALNKFIKSLK